MNTQTDTPMTVNVTGGPGCYRARCPELALYREHRTKTGAQARLYMAINDRLMHDRAALIALAERISYGVIDLQGCRDVARATLARVRQ